MGGIVLERDGPVARILIDNPARYNAMSLSMWRAFGVTVAAVNKDPDVRVIVLRGIGDKAFVSGADISEFETQRNDPRNVAAYNEAVEFAESALAHSTKPVVACIHGVCMGGGIGLALSCDLRYAAKNARFRMPAARMGLGYGYNDVRRMIDAIGAARSADLFYTARTFDGIEAERIGMVHQAFEAADLDVAVEQVLGQVAANAPLTIHAAKLAIRQALADPDDRDPDRVERAVQACFDSADYIEGRRAFTEKRSAKFLGK